MFRRHKGSFLVFAVLIGCALILSACSSGFRNVEKPVGKQPAIKSLLATLPQEREIYLAGGCFWGIEAYMERIEGVLDATSGYANGTTDNPSYEDVIYRNTGHAETVKVLYDASIIDLTGLLKYYFKVIDPLSLNQQGNDRGSQYRTGIYTQDAEELSRIVAFV